MFQIKKINQFPISFNESDVILVECHKIDEIPSKLKEIGFEKCKAKVVDGTKVYYKGKTNAVYITYIN
jgi:hypothetical protein